MTDTRTRPGVAGGTVARAFPAVAGLLAAVPAAAHEASEAPLAAPPEGGGLLGLTRLVLEIQRRTNAEVASHMNAIALSSVPWIGSNEPPR